jgi:hypothetical protein
MLLEGRDIAEGMHKGSVGSIVAMDSRPLLIRSALGEHMDDVLDIADWWHRSSSVTES